MSFNNPIFLYLFFPLFFIIYFILPFKLKNLFILIGSFIFYSWVEPTFIYVVLLSSLLDWYLSKLISQTQRLRLKKICLSLGIVLNIGLLFYFKYFNFFIDNINSILNLIHFRPLGVMEIMLPLGVSFLTFEKIIYIVDVYKEKSQPAKSFIDYLLYVLFFPKLIAGPIVKYHDIEPQIHQRVVIQDDFLEGFFRFAKGLFKKVFIADTLAFVVYPIFNLDPAQVGSLDAWMGFICFTFQIYFDFAGYSDMAIGLSRIMGFRITENFNLPYISQSFTEFWRRWHISLASFIKEYLYIPLGGNRCSKLRQYFNLIFCFLVSGIWHGASWKFLIWGLYHGFFVVMDKILGIKPDVPRKLPPYICTGTTFILVMFSWMIFRVNNLSQFTTFINAMVHPNHIFTLGYLFSNDVFFFLALAIVMSFVPSTKLYIKIRDKLDTKFYLKLAFFIFLLCLSFGQIANTLFESSSIKLEKFIYAQF